MVLFGHESTTSVSFEEVMFMAQAVKRGSQYGLRMVDMPYMSFHLSPMQAVDNAAKYGGAGGEIRDSARDRRRQSTAWQDLAFRRGRADAERPAHAIE